ncbi:MAG: DUF998 domain-containing protein [Planctomycetes bacterium]|jgi:hypothetical protein|nr:DUF998 domain-containing protein [Planctomycetota bacterium]
MKEVKTEPIIISYLHLRKMIGILGISLPISVIIGALLYGNINGTLGSISEYYYSNMREIFVGTLWAMSAFLLSYQGYDRQDVIICRICGLSALGVSLFPTSLETSTLPECLSLTNTPELSNMIHLSCAGVLFLSFSYMSLFLFCKTNKETMTPQKIKRNIIYRITGIIIIVCIVLIFLYEIFFFNSSFKKAHPVLIMEIIMLWAFGLSWLTKGKAIIKD